MQAPTGFTAAVPPSPPLLYTLMSMQC
jgi:hypothetical protein